jgi:hypothetical protein
MRMKLGLAIAALVGFLGMGAAVTAPAQAAPVAVTSAATVAAEAPATIEKVQYSGRPAYGYGHRRHFGPRGFGYGPRHFGHRGYGYGPRHFGHRGYYGHRRGFYRY